MTLPTELPGIRLIDAADINTICSWLRGAQAIVTTDNGTTQALTAAMISSPGVAEVYHNSSGGTTPTLTTPTAAAILATLPDAYVNSAWYLRVINANSGTATVAAGTGVTTSGTLTLATNTWRDFVLQVTGVGAAAAITMTSVGTGTYS